jgi:hypothetical protein
MKQREAWRKNLTDAEVDTLSAEDRAMLMAAAQLDLDNAEHDDEFDGMPYNPVYDAEGRIIV